MLTLRGAPALSGFRLNKLLQRLSAVAGEAIRLSAEYIHFVELDGELSATDTQLLESLLDYGPAHTAAAEEGRLFRITLKHSLILALCMGIVTMLFAYVVPQLVPQI